MSPDGLDIDEGAVGPTPGVVAPLGKVRIAAFGDSLMWGQGLDRKSTFAELTAREIGKQHNLTATTIHNLARSGAKIRPRDDDRQHFLDLFPHLFSGKTERELFLKGEEKPATALYGEVPATFPTVTWQVKALGDAAGATVDVALVNGGGNDIDFDKVLNPMEYTGEFIEMFDGEIRAICHRDTLELIRQVREACPKAVIIFFGYYAPISYETDTETLRGFFKYLSDNDLMWALNKVVHAVDVSALLREAKARAVWAQGRAQYWQSMAIADANANPTIRGPGVIFSPSGFGPHNAVWNDRTWVWDDYSAPTNDPARDKRESECPRREHLAAINGALHRDFVPHAIEVGRAINGPTSLKVALSNLVTDRTTSPTDAEVELARDLLRDERDRIQRCRIASFFHPNTDGAANYATIAGSRYRRFIALRDQIIADERGSGSPAGTGGTETLDAKLHRYNLRGRGSLLADIGHLDVDSLTLRTITAVDSDVSLAPNMYLVVSINVGGTKSTRTYRLSMPNHYEEFPLVDNVVIVEKLYPFFEPGQTNRLTIDTSARLRLDTITGVGIKMGPDTLAGRKSPSWGTSWRPTRVDLEINGRPVVSHVYTGTGTAIGPGDTLDLNYPAAATPPGPVVVGPVATRPVVVTTPSLNRVAGAGAEAPGTH